MITPRQLLQGKQKEATDQYNYLLNLTYPNSSNNNPVIIKKFNDDKEKDLLAIKDKIDEYLEAINILTAVKNCTF